MVKKVLIFVCFIMALFVFVGCSKNPVDDNYNVYVVSFDSDGGSFVESQRVPDGGLVTAPQEPTKDGYTFDGWFTENEEWSFKNGVVRADITLKAHWTENIVTPPEPVEHICNHICPTCGKCTDLDCIDSKCADKCPGHEPKITGTTGVQKNNDILSLSRDLDQVKSLEELTGTNAEKLAASGNVRYLIRRLPLGLSEEDTDGYEDVTTPPDWYTDGTQSCFPGYYATYNDFFTTNTHFYNNAVSVKNNILMYNIQNLNEWYSFGNISYRVSYDEEINDLFFEKITNGNKYVKINVGRDENNKLYYSYISTQYDDLNIFEGIVHQDYIEYKEDEFYNSYIIDRQETGVIYLDGTQKDFYQIVCDFQEVDLSVPGGRFYYLSDVDYYEKTTLKQYDVNRERELEEGETGGGLFGPDAFWMQNGNLIDCRISNVIKKLSMCNNNGFEVMDINYDTYDSWDREKYSGIINLYELDGIKQIKTKIVKIPNGDQPEIYGYTYDVYYIVEFENGIIMSTEDAEPMSEYRISNWGEVSMTGIKFFPVLDFRNLSNLRELKAKLDELGVTFKNFDFNYYVELYESTDGFNFGDITFATDDFSKINQFLISQKKLISIPSVTMDNENLGEAAVPFANSFSYEISGVAVIYDDYIDLSDLEIRVLDFDPSKSKDFKKLDIYYNGTKVTKLDFNFDDGLFTFNEQKHVDLDKNKYQRTEEETLQIKFSKLGIYIDIPFVIGNSNN